MLWKSPPRIKVYEALGALADGRVEMTDATHAKVYSSARQKVYDVEWDLEKKEIASNDNGSYWQRYLSYPGLAVLMQLGALPYDEALAASLKGISWGNLNEQLRRDYVKVEEYVLSLVVKQGVSRETLYDFVTIVLEKLAKLELARPAFLKRPPA
jgi:hypothetical protein